ncbi:MAG TPA: hypothetical protein DEO88_08545, partial [Syntrophobacteraceae bacterium]|nr:hypothetical protein [Syntrophobacteraceae bacterium]
MPRPRYFFFEEGKGMVLKGTRNGLDIWPLWPAVVTVFATLILISALPVCAKELQGAWLAGDFHQHTTYTDGSTSFESVMQISDAFGLDWWANSEHGGSRSHDGERHRWTDPAYYPTNPILGDVGGNPQVMWRWQSLRDFVFPNLVRSRALYPKKRIFSGLEWNVPGHEHCSTGIVADDAGAISAFEFQFDKSDADRSRIGELTPYGQLVKANKTHADAVAACQWMQQQYKAGTISGGWIIFAHVERAGVWSGSGGGYNIENFRDFNNAAPDICFGFEGAPGHQANHVDRGGFGTGAVGGGTYGGVGIYTAAVGGLWDALLGEGRRWFVFANSDYHKHWTDCTDPARPSTCGDDFYPGEYHKTYVHVVDKNRDGSYSLDEIADGMRSGSVYFVHGDLINALEFKAGTRFQEVSMGGELTIEARRRARDPLVIIIKFKSPAVNNHGDTPVVDHIDLIAGRITGKVEVTSPDYTKAVNESTRVIATFTAADWHTDSQGYHVIRYRIRDLDHSTYFRLRGTNLAPNTPNETDEFGNPLADRLIDTSAAPVAQAKAAQADLWVYSNP